MEPLTERMRPHTLEDYIGQEDHLGANGYLRKVVEAGRVPLLIFL